MIVVEVVRADQGIHNCKPCSGAVRHRDCNRTVEGHDGRRLDAFQLSVEPDDFGPVRVCRMSSLAMRGGNCSLYGEWSSRAARRVLHKEQSLGNLLLVPAAAVLFL